MGNKGASSGKGSGAGARAEEIDIDLATSWSEDPSTYQRLADPERRQKAIAEMKNDGYEADEIQEFLADANKIRNLAETQTLPGVSTLYRGERYNSLDSARAKYKIGAEVSTTQLTSYAEDKAMATEYARMYGSSSVSVIITNTNTKGSFPGVRMNHGERQGIGKEVIVKKNLKSKVKSTHYDKKTNTLYVSMEN